MKMFISKYATFVVLFYLHLYCLHTLKTAYFTVYYCSRTLLPTYSNFLVCSTYILNCYNTLLHTYCNILELFYLLYTLNYCPRVPPPHTLLSYILNCPHTPLSYILNCPRNLLTTYCMYSIVLVLFYLLLPSAVLALV